VNIPERDYSACFEDWEKRILSGGDYFLPTVAVLLKKRFLFKAKKLYYCVLNIPYKILIFCFFSQTQLIASIIFKI